MKHLKLYENFKVNNITEDDVVKIIKNNGSLHTSSIKNLPDHNVDISIKPIDIDGDTIIVDIDGDIYQTKLEFITKIED